MKWIFKKLIIVLIEALIVAGLLDALGIDLSEILSDLKAELGEGNESASGEDASNTVNA